MGKVAEIFKGNEPSTRPGPQAGPARCMPDLIFNDSGKDADHL